MNKHLVYTITALLLLVLSGTNTVQACAMEMLPKDDGVSIDYTANAAAIEAKKQEMLTAADSVTNFGLSDDSQDPHAYWLMTRMMCMLQLIQTADDDWAWMLAMNDSVNDYNARLGRKIGSVDAAILAIEELCQWLNTGYQYDINYASYVRMAATHYKTVYEYYKLIASIKDYDDTCDKDVNLQRACYEEFCAWFDVYNSVNGILTFYTHGGSFHSALPMDINAMLSEWSQQRTDEIAIERTILDKWDWIPYKSTARSVHPRRYDKIIDYLENISEDDIVEQMVSQWENKDYEFARQRVGKRYDIAKIVEMARYYDVAISHWRDVREQIAQMLPQEKQKSYLEITKQIHTRLYNDLAELKSIYY
ncbi:MAG: hypothetical protein IJ464_02550 [Alistipes sp.]|nr:hypothetical protein [Alistipes sp.]